MTEYPTTPIFECAVARAIAAENADPQGLPDNILTDMEADILAHPEKYPVLYEALTGGDRS